MKKISSIYLPIISFLSFTAKAQNIPDGSSTPGAALTGLYPYPKNYNQSPNVTPTRVNYVRTFVPLTPVTSLPSFDNTKSMPVIVNTVYTDGWDRPLLNVVRNGSGTDIVKAYDYRPSDTIVDYLPYVDTFHSKFRNNPFTKQFLHYQNYHPQEQKTAYSQIISQNIQGVPTVKSFAPGYDYVGKLRGVTATSNLNNAGEIFKITYTEAGNQVCKNGTYAANSLIVKKIEGQHGQAVLQYIEKSGRPVCKKEYAGTGQGNNGWLTTYYIYNEMDKLICIVPPKASQQLEGNNCVSDVRKLCFLYTYNEYGNLLTKSVPGKDGDEVVVYDKNHIGVLSTSPVLASEHKWYFTILDKQGRPVMTGMYKGNQNAGYWNDVINWGGQPITHYDQNNNPLPPEETLEYWLTNGFSGDVYPQQLGDCEIYTWNYYDNYNVWPADQVSFDNSFSGDYLTGAEMEVPVPYLFARGKLVATRTKILINNVPNNFADSIITTVYFYDEKSRIIQTHTLNPWNNSNWDMSTVQYNFSGKPVKEINRHYSWQGNTHEESKIQNKYIYATSSGRLKGIEQKIDTNAWHAISTLEYDEMSRVRTKRLGGKAEIQNYTFDINSRLTGINAAKLFDTSSSVLATGVDSISFWEDISYAAGFSQKRYDGSVSGFRWRTDGMGNKVMAYGYNYDNANRLTAADFRECMPGVGWNKNATDYTVSNLSYDANGNILTMNQRGYDMSLQPADIDQLTYTYDAGNRLMKVEDDTSLHSPIMDFVNGNVNTTDYQYDYNGNLKSDENKGISLMKYNHFDFPVEIITDSGTIKNIYDADGNLVQKTITENNTTTTYRYWGPYNYKEDSLQFVLNGEGRARWVPDSGAFVYDYFVKDHLGNVRTVVESQVTYDQISYHAGFEVFSANLEEQLWGGIGIIRDNAPIGTPGDLSSGWLDGMDPDHSIGASLLVHAMAGDHFNLKGYGYFESEVIEEYNTYATPEAMMESLLGALTAGAVPGGGGDADNPVNTINNLITTDNYTIYSGLKDIATDPNYPRAYLNYLVFTDDLQLQSQYSQVVQLRGSANTWNLMELPDEMTMPINGFLLCYFSNECQVLTAIDNIYAVHIKGHLLEEQHYYPHGLPIQAIGGQLNTPLANKYLTTGNRMQEEAALQLLDFNARNYDQQIGRFTSIDPLADYKQESLSPFHFCGNNPANYIDPDGLSLWSWLRKLFGGGSSQYDCPKWNYRGTSGSRGGRRGSRSTTSGDTGDYGDSDDDSEDNTTSGPSGGTSVAAAPSTSASADGAAVVGGLGGGGGAGSGPTNVGAPKRIAEFIQKAQDGYLMNLPKYTSLASPYMTINIGIAPQNNPNSNMHLSQEGYKYLKSVEKFVDHLYDAGDAYGKRTIGYGYVVPINDVGYYTGCTITETEASQLLQKEVEETYEGIIKDKINIALTQGQFDGLLINVYNTGSVSPLLRKLINNEAACELIRQEWFTRVNARVNGKRKFLKGLLIRRIEEFQIWEYNYYERDFVR